MAGEKIYSLCWRICILLFLPLMALSQDVIISVPANNIFSRTEFNTVENVLSTSGNTHWRKSLLINLLYESPNFESVSGNRFAHTSIPGAYLSNLLLEWQLKTIGGTTNFEGGVIPGYQSFSSSIRLWYDLHLSLLSWGADYTAGNVAFGFRIPSHQFGAHAFYAGSYTMTIKQNYGTANLIFPLPQIIFTPATFNVVISIAPAISWLSASSSRYFEVTSLSPYRAPSEYTFGNLAGSELGHTVNTDLKAKTASPNIQFISSKNIQETRPISVLRLGSNHTNLPTKSLSSSWQTFTSSPFAVPTGNRTTFTQDIRITAQDLRNYFFKAGTYNFQLNREATDPGGFAGPGGFDTDVTIYVPPLSEISVGAGGPLVKFNFNNLQHYSQGQSKVVPQQIKLSNNEDYELYVKAQTNYFRKSGIQSDIGADILQVGVDGSPVQVNLSTTPQKIISNGNPVLDQELDIRYTIPAAKAQSLVSKEKTTYSIDLIYSFTVH